MTARGTVTASGGNSTNWNSTTTTVSTNETNWTDAYDSWFANSQNWDLGFQQRGSVIDGTGLEWLDSKLNVDLSEVNYFSKTGNDLSYSDGNVGIGTGATAPTEKIEVDGNGLFSGSLRSNSLFTEGAIVAKTGIFDTYHIDNGGGMVVEQDMVLMTDGVERLRILASDAIGDEGEVQIDGGLDVGGTLTLGPLPDGNNQTNLSG